MNFLGIGPMELMLILIAALVIFGPRRLPEMGAQVGRALAEFRKATNDLTKDFRDLNLQELVQNPLESQVAQPAAAAYEEDSVEAEVTPPEGMVSPVEVRTEPASTSELDPDAAVVDLLVEQEELPSLETPAGNGVEAAPNGYVGERVEGPAEAVEAQADPGSQTASTPVEGAATDTDTSEVYKGEGI